MADVSFEHKFGQLADSQISEKLPSLVEHRVGFQVIDKTEDDTKAVGVAAFVVNNLWLYIPVFFLKGNIKGLDLIYVKQKDIFVPALDNWISSIKEQGTKAIGKSELAGDENIEKASPENTQILDEGYSSLGKEAAFDDNAIITESTWLRMKTKLAALNATNFSPIDLMSDIPKLGKAASRAFLETFLNSPEFSNSLFSFYDVGQVSSMAKSAAFSAATPNKPTKDDVVIISDMTSKEAKDLGDREKELLVRNGIYVKDNRTTLSKIFQEEVDSSVLQNPTSPGLYDVLLSDGSFKTFIIFLPKHISDTSITSRRFRSSENRQVCLVDIDNPQSYTSKRSSDVYCKPATSVTADEMAGIQGGKKASRTLLAGLNRDTGVLFVQNPENSIATRIINREGNPDGSFSVTVRNSAGYTDGHLSFEGGTDRSVVRVEFVGPEAQLRLETGYLFVPEGTRVFTRRTLFDGRTPAYPKQHTPREVSLGDSSTVLHQVIHKQANLRHLRVHSTEFNAQVLFGEQSTGLISKEAAAKHLIWRHGIGGGQALQILKEAEASPHAYKGYLIKHAAPYDTAAYGYSEPPWMGGPSTSQEEAVTEEVSTLEGKSLTTPSASDNSPVLPGAVIEQATQAAEQGIKEVFDVRILQGLIDKADISEIRKDYISDMVVGMDKVGRMLFLFYWHNDEFEARYGKEDLTKLEDTLTNVFKKTGDLVLFLREKTSYNPTFSEDIFGSLSEDIAV
jgi:hypothetical protein